MDPALIKRLRAQTGAGVMDCRQALEQAGGQYDEAVRRLKVQGAATAAKKHDRVTKAGAIAAYVHGGRIGVLVEVGCETDFVARNEKFQDFVHQLLLHIAAMHPTYVRQEDVPPEETGSAGLVLLDQPFVKDESKTIQDLLTELIAVTGENVVIRRFTRYQLGDVA